MKKFAAALCAMLLIPTMAGASGAYYSVAELKEQVKTAQNGAFEAAVYLPDVEKLPILSVKPKDVEKSGQGELAGYPTAENKNEEKYDLNTNAKRETHPETTYENLFLPTEAPDFKQIYAANQPYSAEEAIRRGAAFVQSLDEGAEVLPLSLTIQSPWIIGGTGENYPCQALTGVGGYFVSYAPVLHGIPVVGGIGMAFEESAPISSTLRRMLRAESRYIYMMYAEDYCSLSGLNIWEESSVKAEDIPLCAFEKIAQTIERNIENGTIETVHDIMLGYVVYMDETAEGTDDAQTAAYAAVPTWCASVQYSGKWKDKGWMMLNAQTGEAYAYSSQNISDWYAPIVGEN